MKFSPIARFDACYTKHMAYRKKTNWWKWTTILLILAILGGGGYLIYSSLPKTPVESPIETPVSEPVNNSEITVSEKSDSEESDIYEISIQYPVLKGLPKEINTRANQTIEQRIDTIVSDFKKNNAPEPGVLLPEKNSLDIRFNKNITVTDKTVTIVLNISDYFGGAAHPNSYASPVTVSRTTGLLVSPKDFFKTGTNYIGILSQKAKPVLQGRLKDDFVVAGAEAKSENYEHIYLTNEHVVVIFNPYQVAPYAAGIQEVKIPRSELQAILK